jgi:hypothetical protein
MIRRVFPGAATAAALAAGLTVACSSGTTANPPATRPAPQPGAPEAPAPTTPGHGPAVVYRPLRSTAYRLERHDSLTLEYQGGASQEQVRDRTAYLHVALAEGTAPGALQVTIVLDSLQALENGQPASPDSVLAARGTRWTAALTSSGGLGPLTADKAGTLPDELTGRLRLLFPALPAGGVRTGMAWTDTTEYKLTADAFPGSERAVTTYSAEDASGGRKGITLQSTGTYQRSGTQTQTDQKLEMTATGTRRGQHVLGLDGVLVSAQGNDVGDMTITVPSVGQTVPVKQRGSYSVTSGAGR